MPRPGPSGLPTGVPGAGVERVSLADLTGAADGPPIPPPRPMRARLDALASRIARLSAAAGEEVDLDWEDTLTLRARLLGLRRQGRVSANGSCRLVRCADRWMALNLARPDDVAAVAALTGLAPGVEDPGPWGAVEVAASRMPGADLVARARLLGMPAAALATPCVKAATTHGDGRFGVDVEERWAPLGRPRRTAELVVVDLSSMWAGPLAAMLLSRAGATVRKVESAARPDGARAEPAVYRRLHPPGQEEMVLDLSSAAGRRELRAVVEGADVVIESSRPRALEQLGCGPDQVAARPGRVWLAVTGYGRQPPGSGWVAFGDDAAVAGGLVGWQAPGTPVFLGDAVADPVTGMAAAAAVLGALQRGGGVLVDAALARGAAAMARPSEPCGS